MRKNNRKRSRMTRSRMTRSRMTGSRKERKKRTSLEGKGGEEEEARPIRRQGGGNVPVPLKVSLFNTGTVATDS